MATAAIIGGGALIGGLLAGQGAKKQAEANVEAANIQAAQQQAALEAAQQQQVIENQRAESLLDPAMQAQQTQLALLGQGGDEAAQQAAGSLLNSPLVQAINQQNQQNISAQAAASGVSGGNLLSALQQANTGTILQAGLGGLGQIAGQQQSGALGFGGLASGALGLATQQQNLVGQSLGQAASAQGTVNAMPFLTGANILNQGTQLAGFGLGGGFGSMQPQAAGSGVGAMTGTGTGTINSPMGFGSAPLL